MQDEEDDQPQIPARIPLPVVQRVGGPERDYYSIFECEDEDKRIDNWMLLIRACKAGCTDTQIAELLQVRRESVWRWKNSHPAFAECINNHKTLANNRVVEALYERATGLKVTVNKAMIINRELVFVETEEYYPPDVKAAEVWLYNRDKENWKKAQSINVSASTSLPAPEGYDLSNLTTEETELLLALSKKAAIQPKQLEE